MANAAPLSSGSSTPSPNRKALQRSGVSWTDDLPVCKYSDVGIVPNAVYLPNGRTMEAHQYSDYSFNFRAENGCYLYGLFDGHDGVKAAHFAASRLPAELLLGQINPSYNPSDSSIQKVLYQSFSIVERGFFESIDDALAKRTHLQSQIPERLARDVARERLPNIFAGISALDSDIKGGTTAVVALVINNKLFVTNVGECRALLCQFDVKTNQIEVQQLSVDHNIYQIQEQARLKTLGINIEKLQNRGKLGLNECSRCIGDYSVKGGYKENEFLRTATSEPSIAEPSITEGLIMSEYPGSFLILMSDDLYKSIQQCSVKMNANEYIARLTSRQLMLQRSITGVAQAVVEKIAHLHEYYFKNKTLNCRGDMTLIVRNFSHPIGNKASPMISFVGTDEYHVSVPYMPVNGQQSNTGIRLVMPNPGSLSNQHRPLGSYSSGSPSSGTPTNIPNINPVMVRNSENSVHGLSLDVDDDDDDDDDADDEEAPEDDGFYRCDDETPQVDEDGRVKSYIKFDTFFEHKNNTNTDNRRTAWSKR